MVLMYLQPCLGSGLQGEGVLQGKEGGIKLRFGQVNKTKCENCLKSEVKFKEIEE